MLIGTIISLRAIEEKDLEILKSLRNHSKTRLHTREFRLLSNLNQKNWFRQLFIDNPPKNIMFVIIKKQKIVGITGLTYIDWKNRNAEISIIVDPSIKNNKKILKQSIKMILDYGFGELGLHRIWAEIFNIANDRIQLFEEMQFVYEGTLKEKLWRDNKWFDSRIYAKISEDV